MRLFLFFLILSTSLLPAQGDTLLQQFSWRENQTEQTIKFTADGTFQLDYGTVTEKKGRYLMGRYAFDETESLLLLSVDYFMGKNHLPSRYRRGNDFYLEYRVDVLTNTQLELTDVLTGKPRGFVATGEDIEDPAASRLPKPNFGKLKLPEGWGG